jgi:hypothetical protein
METHMKKRSAPKRKRPVRLRPRTGAQPGANVLSIILDPGHSHYRRSQMVRFALDKGRHRTEASEVGNMILINPDRSMTAREQDLLLRALGRATPAPAVTSLVLPDSFWGHAIADIPLYAGAKFVSQRVWDSLPDREKFPLSPLKPQRRSDPDGDESL